MVSCRQRWCLSALPSLAWSFILTFASLCPLMTEKLAAWAPASGSHSRQEEECNKEELSLHQETSAFSNNFSRLLLMSVSRTGHPHIQGRLENVLFIAYYTASLGKIRYWSFLIWPQLTLRSHLIIFPLDFGSLTLSIITDNAITPPPPRALQILLCVWPLAVICFCFPNTTLGSLGGGAAFTLLNPACLI